MRHRARLVSGLDVWAVTNFPRDGCWVNESGLVYGRVFREWSGHETPVPTCCKFHVPFIGIDEPVRTGRDANRHVTCAGRDLAAPFERSG
jgi:hypothetical protein